MNRYAWAHTDSNTWGKRTMEDYIWHQNNVIVDSYDFYGKITHSAEALIQWADMDNPKTIAKFKRVYAEMYKDGLK